MSHDGCSESNHPKFKRVRIVEIKNNYLICSCQLPQRWLMPCVHIYCVLKKKEYVMPSMFHLRWWKHFNYIFQNEVNYATTDICKKLEDALFNIRSNHFDQSDNNKYKGVYLNNIPKFKEKVQILWNNEDSSDEVITFMMYVLKKNLINIPLCQNTKIDALDFKLHVREMYGREEDNDETEDNALENNSFTINELKEESDEFNPDEELEIVYQTQDVEGMGAGSHTFSQLSQSRIDEETFTPIDLTRAKESSENAFYTLEPMFKELLNSISTYDQLEKARSGLERLNFDVICMGNKTPVKSGETTFLGQINGSRKKEIRHKALYERHRVDK